MHSKFKKEYNNSNTSIIISIKIMIINVKIIKSINLLLQYLNIIIKKYEIKEILRWLRSFVRGLYRFINFLRWKVVIKICWILFRLKWRRSFKNNLVKYLLKLGIYLVMFIWLPKGHALLGHQLKKGEIYLNLLSKRGLSMIIGWLQL